MINKNQIITHLVVGPARVMRLGQAVNQRHRPGSIGRLVWRNGTWMTRQDLLAKFWSAINPSADVTRIAIGQSTASRRTAPLTIAVTIAVITATFGIAGYVLLSKRASPGLDFVASAPAPALQVVPKPWISVAPQDGQPPIPTGFIPQPSETPIEPNTPAAAKAAEPVQSSKTAPPKDTSPPKALVIDVEAASTPKPSTNTPEPSVPNSPPAPKRLTLVAITPDGKTALIANPATRLPEKYGVGDKLPNGELVKQIDALKGVVSTSVSDYKLE